jgi:pseudaminic acid cytidylyltransferase
MIPYPNGSPQASCLLVVPARSGSKRIPHKNIRKFHGLPIMAYPILAALKSDCFSEIMVSTDEESIALIARKYGASVPFLRSKMAASDHASTEAVIQEVITAYRQLGREFDYICCLYPTAALVQPIHLQQGLQQLLSDPNLTGVLPVLPFGYPVQRAITLRDGRTVMMYPEHYDSRSQDLERAYHDAGQWYWSRRDHFETTHELIGPNCAAVILSEMEAQDIDHEDDWRLAEVKYELLRDHA